MDETDAPATPTPPAPPRSIGERAGLSVAAAAEKLHLDPKVIESLEGDRFAELGASVYVRGHLRRYADFVGEPGAELVALYTAREVRPPPPDLTQVPHTNPRTDPRKLVTPILGLSGAAVLLLAIWWVVAGSRSGPEPSAVPSPVVPAAQTAPVAALPAASAPTVTPSPAAIPPAPVASDAANAAPKREEVPVRETRLKLDLTNDSWVEVYDGRGDRLFYDVASAGSVQSVSGRGPLRVVLGNAAGVTVEVDGQAREIPESAIDGEGARFVVNRSGSLSRAR
jgi:cytoskeleton protein RodZ